MRNEFARRDAVANSGFDCRAQFEFALHTRFEPGQAVPAAAFGVVHRHVSAVQQGLDIIAAAGFANRDTGRDRGFQLCAFKADWLGDGSDDAFHQSLNRRGLAWRRGRDDRKFIAAEPRQQRFGRQHCADPLGRRAKQSVASGMAVAVIYLLEAIEIEHHISQRFMPGSGAGRQLGTVRSDAAAVEALGQGIAVSQAQRIGFGCAPPFQFAGQIAVAPPAKDDQRDIEHQRVAEQQIGIFAATRNGPDRARQHRHGQVNEQRDCRKCDCQDNHIAAGAAQPCSQCA